MKNWSPLQNAIFAAMVAGKKNLIVRAGAGSGKTTTWRANMYTWKWIIENGQLALRWVKA